MDPLNPLGLSTTLPTPSFETSLKDASVDSLLDLLVHEMTPPQLAEYVKRLSVLRSSAQTRKAALTQEAQALGTEKKASKKTPKKDSVSEAMALLLQLTPKV